MLLITVLMRTVLCLRGHLYGRVYRGNSLAVTWTVIRRDMPCYAAIRQLMERACRVSSETLLSTLQKNRTEHKQRTKKKEHATSLRLLRYICVACLWSCVGVASRHDMLTSVELPLYHGNWLAELSWYTHPWRWPLTSVPISGIDAKCIKQIQRYFVLHKANLN